MKEQVEFTVNGSPVSLDIDSSRLLIWVLRTELGLTGTKYGCGESVCGSCTVIVDGEAVRSCQTVVGDVQGSTIITIEGLADGDTLHPIQKAFADHDALQCGFCTPGMIMNAYGLLQQNPEPDHAEIIEGMEDNLCRCGAHTRIIDAIKSAAKDSGGGR